MRRAGIRRDPGGKMGVAELNLVRRDRSTSRRATPFYDSKFSFSRLAGVKPIGMFTRTAPGNKKFNRNCEAQYYRCWDTTAQRHLVRTYLKQGKFGAQMR
jgi:hypothetical protein